MMDRFADTQISRDTKFAEHRRFQDQCETDKNNQGNGDRLAAISARCFRLGIHQIHERKSAHA